MPKLLADKVDTLTLTYPVAIVVHVSNMPPFPGTIFSLFCQKFYSCFNLNIIHE